MGAIAVLGLERGIRMVIVYVIALIFTVLGIALLTGKAAMLMAGYNTMSAAARARYRRTHDVVKQSRILGAMMLVIAATLFLMALVDTEAFAATGGCIIVVSIIAALIFVNTACKRRKEDK